MSISPENLATAPAVRLHQILASYFSSSSSTESGNLCQSVESTSELADFLNTISDSVAAEPDNEELESTAFEVLSEVHKYVSTPIDQDVMDALSFELPKTVARFSSACKRCMDLSESVIDQFIATCSPRDMLSVLCEALGSSATTNNSCRYYAVIFSGLTKVFPFIERRPFERVKAALPGIFNVLKSISTETYHEDADLEDLFNKTIGIASSIQAICVKLEGSDGKDKKKMHGLFGITVLQIMAFSSISLGHDVSRCQPLVLRLFQYLPYCHLSYLSLITGADVDKITSIVFEGTDDEDDYLICFSHVKLGAALAVIWGQLSNEVSVIAKSDLAKVKDDLRSCQAERWLSMGLLKHIFICVNLSWQLKKHAIQFLLDIMEGSIPDNSQEEHIDDSVYMPSLYAALQAVQMVIMYASDRVLRKMAFEAFKVVLTDIPARPRFDILVSLIKNSDSSSMTAILLDCFRGEMHKENRQRVADGNEDPEPKYLASQSIVFWSAEALELVEFILRPSQGGPPILPEDSDAALSALNLYRYILITESTGKTNYTGALSKENLQKSYKEWVLPLRTLVSSIVAESQMDHDHVGCVLNPVELVLYHCIELIEESMKQSI